MADVTTDVWADGPGEPARPESVTWNGLGTSASRRAPGCSCRTDLVFNPRRCDACVQADTKAQRQMAKAEPRWMNDHSFSGDAGHQTTTSYTSTNTDPYVGWSALSSYFEEN